MSTRQKIIQSGVELLQTQGIAALTQPRVARAAGVSQGNLTYHFPTRNDLLLAVAEAAIEGVLGHLKNIAIDPAGGDLGTVLGELIPRQAPVRVMLGLIVAAEDNPALRAALDGLFTRVRRGITGLLEARGLGGTPEHALIAHAAFVGLAVMNHARHSEDSAAEFAVGARTLFHLLAADAAGSASP
jgi:AcrR family transcriptional regulator